ncbi:zinc-binding dehydrogenase [Micromonospora sp. ATCC 39149]|uniref:Zinc-binding dehydrogenase n=1 Tax=Micromonospora carbonacea TaxID=47853 RepID=A0A7D6GG94_9ACTN|nr:zinc-binding dehydrogenase [Micromonospora sp. ATCC 39149]QLK00706.1 zinc-binding dehydrogenase [Micromonospora carbonacea]
MRAVVLRRPGGPEALRVERIPEPSPGAGESLIDVTLTGVNFDDVERTAGAQPELPLPAVLGVEAVGYRRTDGRRVVALLRQGGGYAEVVAARDAHTVEIPVGIDDAQALGLFEQGGTAYGALSLAGRLRAGESVAVSAAAGGVGHLAVQLAVALGASPVIGLASTSVKRQFVKRLGADLALDPADPELADRVREAAGGAGVDLFVDSVGGAVAQAALASLAPFGRLVCLGWRSATQCGPGTVGGGAVPAGAGPAGTQDMPGVVAVTTAQLAQGSIGCVGFWMRHVVDDRGLLCGVADRLFELAGRGRLTVHVDRTVALHEVGAAHAAIAARATAGKVLIDVRREA